MERDEKGREDGERGEQRLEIKDTMFLHSTREKATTKHEETKLKETSTSSCHT